MNSPDDSIKATFSSTFLAELKTRPYFPQRLYKNFFLKERYGLSESELLEANAQHQRGSDFFSASYSGDWLFLAMGQEKIGVDIEIIKPRSFELLEKYTSELNKWFQKSDWIFFYHLWTAKEAILKASNQLNLDLIDQIQICDLKHEIFSNQELEFHRFMKFQF